MADINKSIEIIFGATDNTGNVFSDINRELSSFGGALGVVTQPMADITVGILKLDAALVALGATFVGFAVNEAGKFHEATSEINTLLSTSPEAFSRFSDEILEYSKDSTQSIESITGAVYSAISAGVDYENSLDLLTTAERLSVAGKADLDSTTRALVSTLNAYGAGTEDAARYSDILFTTVKEGQTTLPELAASLSQITGIAAGAGVPFETVTAAIAALTAQGFPTSEAITAIRSAISNIIKPTADAAKLARELGIEFNATALKTQGFDGVLQAAAESTGGSTDQLARLFGSVQGLGGVLALTSNDSELFVQKLDAMANSAGSTQVAFEKMENELSIVHTKLANNWKAMLIEFGGPLMDEYGDIVESFGELLQSLGTYFTSEDFAPIIALMEQAAAKLADFIRGVATALPEAMRSVNLDSIVDAFDDLGVAIGGVFGDLDLTKPEDLSKAIQALVDAFAGLVRATEGIAQIFGPIIAELGAMGVESSSLAPELGRVIGQVSAVGAALNILAGILPSIGTALQVLGSALAVIGVSKAAAAIGGLAAAFNALAPVLAVVAGYEFGDWLDRNTTLGDQFTASLQNIGRMFGYVSEEEKQAALSADILAQKIEYAQRVTGDATLNAQNYKQALEDWRAESLSAQGGTESFAAAVEQWGENVTVVNGRIVVAGERMDEFGRIAGEVGNALPQEAIDELNEKLRTHVTIWTEAGPVLREAAMSEKEIDDVLGQIYGNVNANTAAMQSYNAALEGTKTVGDYTVTTLENADGVLEHVWTKTKAAAEATEDFSSAMVTGATSAEDLSKKINLSASEAAKLYVELEKIASDERIKTMEFAVSFKIEKLKSDTEKTIAAFESIDTAIQSTGDLLGSLFGNLTAASSWNVKRIIEEQIDLENKRRQEALDKQNELIDSQIAMYEAQAEALSSGDALIKIQADGMEPEIEAFMWKILEKLQARANLEGSEFLLNIAT